MPYNTREKFVEYRNRPEVKARRQEKDRLAYWANPDKFRERGAKYRDNPERRERAKRVARDWYKKNGTADLHRWYKFGLKPEEFTNMLARQQGTCAICGILLVCARHRADTCCVDHDHVTGKVRGLLCVPCNTKLGVVEDFEWFDKAVEYTGLQGGTSWTAIATV